MVRVSSALIKKRKGIFQKILKGFQLVSEDDNITIITREQAEKCIELISSVKDDIIASFPSTNTLRCRQGVAKDTHCLTVLRQLLRYYNKRLISQRTKVPRTKGCKMYYTYKIAI